MNYPMSEIGKEVMRFQEEIAEKYKYKRLDYDYALNCMRYYLMALPEGFKLTDPSLALEFNPEIYKCPTIGFEVKKKNKIPLFSRDGTLIATTYERIVIGHYGAYIEMRNKDIEQDNVKCKKGQEYRIRDPKYMDKVKFLWYTTTDESDCKLYLQRKGVVYADYLVSRWYVSPFEVLDKNEVLNLLRI